MIVYTYKEIQKAIDSGEDPIVAFSYFDKTDAASSFTFPTKLHVPYNKSKPTPGITVTTLYDHMTKKIEQLTEQVANLELTVACNHDHGSGLTQHGCATPTKHVCAEAVRRYS